jgi:predicted component of viral defense system (DUF524 family)
MQYINDLDAVEQATVFPPKVSHRENIEIYRMAFEKIRKENYTENRAVCFSYSLPFPCSVKPDGTFRRIKSDEIPNYRIKCKKKVKIFSRK